MRGLLGPGFQLHERPVPPVKALLVQPGRVPEESEALSVQGTGSTAAAAIRPVGSCPRPRRAGGTAGAPVGWAPVGLHRTGCGLTWPLAHRGGWSGSGQGAPSHIENSAGGSGQDQGRLPGALSTPFAASWFCWKTSQLLASTGPRWFQETSPFSSPLSDPVKGLNLSPSTQRGAEGLP